MLEIVHFSKTYKGGKVAVQDLNLKVESGDIFGFIGRNGAGKSTTIKAVCGALDFDEGNIFVNGVSVKDDPVACKKVTAYIPDNPDLYEYMTGYQFLDFIANVFGVSAEDKRERMEKYARTFGIESALGDLVSTYSHGMKQKLAVVSALVHKPLLMVLDEPFVGLDPNASHDLKEIMAERCREGGAVFFSTHVLEVAEKLCNKIAIIDNGRLVACGETAQVIGSAGSLEDLFLELTNHG
ncbi:MAG: ABC transporter ATP-binding protein [Candidatus Borkfalkiaceae bacterium]|nr:ABC transporter ATP-binding protein [Christensenellaceae bacterium]